MEPDSYKRRKSLGINGHLLLGADRMAVYLLAAFSAYLGFVLTVSQGVYIGGPVGILFWVVGIFPLRKMANADPLMRQVALRHTQYKNWYPARGRLNAKLPSMKPFIRY